MTTRSPISDAHRRNRRPRARQCRRSERANPAVLELDEELLAIVGASEGIGRLVETILVERPVTIIEAVTARSAPTLPTARRGRTLATPRGKQAANEVDGEV